MKIVKMDKLAGLVAALLLVCIAAPLFAADNAALIKAAESGNTSAVKALIEAGADVNARNNRGETALMRAAWKGHADTVLTLINAGADVNAQDKNGDTAIVGVAVLGYTDIMKALINAGADVNAQGGAALMLATNLGHTEIVDMLKAAGAR